MRENLLRFTLPFCMPSPSFSRRLALRLAPSSLASVLLACVLPASAQVTAPAAATAPTTAPALSITSSTHADSLVRDFGDGKTGFAPYAAPGGVPSGATLSLVNGALKIVNAHPGSFGMTANMAPFDALKYGTLAFDYKIGPGVKVNIFLRVKGKYHGIIFCGPDRVRPGSIKLGAIADVKTDDQWHRAVVPVRAWLQKLYPQDESLMVDEIIMGNWDNTGYLVAGFGGNPSGATYWLDNWSFVGARSTEKSAKFQVNAEGTAPLSYALDFDAPKLLSGKTLEVSPSDGFHVLTVSRGGKAKGSASYPFWMSGTAPSAQPPRLVNNMIEVPVSGSAPLDVRVARATVAGQAFSMEASNAARPAPLQVEPSRDGSGSIVRIAVGAAGMKFTNGQAVPVEVALKDLLGREVSGAKGQLKVDFSQQDAAPPAPRVKFERSGVSWDWDGTFERNTGGWTPSGSDGAIIERDASTSAGGDYSLRFTCPSNAATFRSTLQLGSPNIAQFPIVSFDYKATPDLRMDFLLSCEGTLYRVAWTDKGERANAEIGQVPNVKTNGQWQHAEFNLAEMLRKVKPNSKELKVDWFAMTDSGWMGNARSVQYWIDNFRLVPIEKSPLQAQVLADDVTGVQAVAYSVDTRSQSPVDLSKKVAGDRISATGNGREYLHLRVQNGAGQWSPPADFPLLLDANAPAVTAQLPLDGSEASPAAQVWTVSDETGIDTSALSLEVNGQKFAGDDRALSFNRASGALTWDPLRAMAENKFAPLEDGAKVNWKLLSLQDRAGNSDGTRAGSWTWKRALDKMAPTAVVTSPTHPALQFDSFEPGGGVPVMGAAREADAVKIVDVEGGGHALRVSAQSNNAPLWVLARGESWDLSKFPIASFRYRIAPQVANLSLRLNLEDSRAWHIRLKGEANDSLGKVHDVVADGKWHWAQVNLAEMLKRDPKADATRVQSLDFIDPMRATPKDAWYEIDDFALSAPAGGEVKLSWAAYDLAGVESFRVAWDQKPDTAPIEAAADHERTLKAEAGTYFMHVQASDKAGNQGVPTHFPVIVR